MVDDEFDEEKQAQEQIPEQSEFSEESVDPKPERETESGLESDTETQIQLLDRGLVSTQQRSAKAEAPAVRKPRVTLQTLATVIFAGIVVATLLTLWMPSAFTGEGLEEQYVGAITAPQQTQESSEGIQMDLPSEFPENKIGIIISHKDRDDGEICTNGLTEVEINSTVATYLQQALIKLGYEAELLDETDPRLVGYQASLLISLHCNSCEYINDNATGFKFAIKPSDVKTVDREALTECLSEKYANATGLKYHYQTTTNEIRNYHAFDQIDPLTAAMIFELGYMNLDLDLLTNRPEVLATGIAEGLHCYFRVDE